MAYAYWNHSKFLSMRLGNQVTINALKDLLRKEVTDNYSFYSSFSEDCTNVIEEIEKFLSNPVKYYASDTADLILQALARALSIKGTVFKINSDGLVSGFDVGVDASQSHLTCCFARTDVCHVDSVLDLIDILTESEGSPGHSGCCYWDAFLYFNTTKGWDNIL